MREAQLEDFGSGLTPVSQGWFVVNVRDAEWWFSERRGAKCAFENEYGDPPVYEPCKLAMIRESGQRPAEVRDRRRGPPERASRFEPWF